MGDLLDRLSQRYLLVCLVGFVVGSPLFLFALYLHIVPNVLKVGVIAPFVNKRRS